MAHLYEDYIAGYITLLYEEHKAGLMTLLSSDGFYLHELCHVWCSRDKLCIWKSEIHWFTVRHIGKY